MIFETQRFIAVPVEAVFGAFEDPEALKTWWGPAGFTNTFIFFDFSTNGRWSFTMHGPDGKNYPNENVFQALDPNKIVIRHTSEPHFTLTVTIEPANGGTMVFWRQEFDNPGIARNVAHIVVPANEENLDRLTQHLGALLQK